MVRALGAAMALSFAGSALALPQGAYWVEVPVVPAATDFAVAGSALNGYRSFDLYVQLQAGDVVFAQDSGIASNTGLQYTNTLNIFNHPQGGDAGVNGANLAFFGNLIWDSRSQMGTLANGQFGNPVGPWNYNAGGGLPGQNKITGVTSANVPAPGSASPDGSGAFWFARITISSSGAFGAATGLTEYLGGQIFVSGDGPNGQFGGAVPLTGVVNVPNAFPVPTPGALAIFGAAGIAAARRRRSS